MPTYRRTSVDTRVALGDSDGGPHTSLRGATTTPPVRTCMRLSVSRRASECPPGAIQVSTKAPHHVGTELLLRRFMGA